MMRTFKVRLDTLLHIEQAKARAREIRDGSLALDPSPPPAYAAVAGLYGQGVDQLPEERRQ